MKVAIVGSRTLTVENLGSYLPHDTTEVISGGARGIDTCAKEYCIKNAVPITEIFPDYKTYGRGAPLVRNCRIVDNADFVLIFWDGSSKGTRFVIDRCIKLGKKHKTYIKAIKKE